MDTVKCLGKKLNKTALVIATIHFFLSFFSDRIIFEYAWMDSSTWKELVRSAETIVVKVIFGVILVLLWQWIFWATKHADRRFLKVAGGYMLFMSLVLLLTWPGIWRMDEFGILSSSLQLFPHFWQNYITTVFYVVALMLIPVPAGVVIVQCACISLIVARVMMLARAACEYSERGKRFQWILFLPFFMFPVIDSNLYPIRMSLYAFLELWLLAELYFMWRRMRRKKTDGTLGYWSVLTVLAAVVTVWRTEAMYYVVAYPVLLLLLGKGLLYKKQITCYLIMFVVLFAPQKIGEQWTSGEQYELTSVVLPLVPLMEAADQSGEPEDKKLLEVIDTVINVDVTLEGAQNGKSGINLFWGEPKFQRQYDRAQFAEFKSAYYKLVIRYPLVFLKERWQTFLDSSDLLENTTDLYVKDGVMNYDIFREYPLSEPIANEIRTSVIKMLELRDRYNYNEKLGVTDMVYSAVPAVFVLALAVIAAAWKRRGFVAVLLLTALVKVPLVFLTAPSRLFMYYYSVYLIGYCVLFYALFGKSARKVVTKVPAVRKEGKKHE